MEKVEALGLDLEQGESAAWEAAVFSLANEHAKRCDLHSLKQLFGHCREKFDMLPKARTAKMVRRLLDYVGYVPGAQESQIDFCREYIAWCEEEKRRYLRHRIQLRLIHRLLLMGRLADGMGECQTLLKEVKQLDDKLLLVDVYLLQAKLYFSMGNVPSAKGTLTACRNHANAVHCPPLIQAAIELLAGKLNMREGDYKTAISYFHEALEGFTINQSQSDRKLQEEMLVHTKQMPIREIPLEGNDEGPLAALQYMLLANIFFSKSKEIKAILAGKNALPYRDHINIMLMEESAKAHANADVHAFQSTAEKYRHVIKQDDFLTYFIEKLGNLMFDKNLIKIVKPYSDIQLPYLAEIFKVSIETIEHKMVTLLLDQTLNGTIDRSSNVLTLHQEPPVPPYYTLALEVLNNLHPAIEALQEKIVST